MVRPFQEKDEILHGNLVITSSSGDQAEVSYVPPPSRLADCGISPSDANKYTTKLIELDIDSGRFSIFPIRTIGPSEDFLKPKYKQVTKITLAGGKRIISRRGEMNGLVKDYARSLTFGATQPLEEDVDDADIAQSPESAELIMDILESLPPAFTKDYDYGLGLAKQYRFIVDAVETLTDCTEIVISGQGTTRVDNAGEIFHISTNDFETIRKTLDSRTRLGQVAVTSVKSAEAHNFFAAILDRPPIPINVGRHPLRKLFTRAVSNDGTYLSEEEQEKVIGVITQNMKSISESKPERLLRLRNDIELVNLENLIERFRGMLERRLAESVWQEFFDENPFILSLAFGYPIIKVGSQSSVGGRKLSGKGEKISDFLVKNSKTNNAAVVEIKTPNAKLLKNTQFRRGVFPPSKILSDSTIQALDQKYQFQRDISGIKDRSREPDIESYSVQCYLVVGTIPETEDEQKSFELYRGNSKDVNIVTFDELLEKLVQLRDLLASSDKSELEPLPEFDVPF